MEIIEYQENGMIIREIRLNGILIGKEVFPIPSDIPVIPGPTEIELLKLKVENQEETIGEILEAIIPSMFELTV